MDTSTTMTAMFRDDTTLLSVSEFYAEAKQNLQYALDCVTKWMKDWKIKLNKQKSVALTRQNTWDLHFDAKLTWRGHINVKAQQIREKIRQIYWLIERHPKMKLENKRLSYHILYDPSGRMKFSYRAAPKHPIEELFK